MKVNEYHNPHLAESHVDLYYHTLDEEITSLLTFLDRTRLITGKNENETRLIAPRDIYYCEVVDRKCYAYLKQNVWKVEEGIQTLTDRYHLDGFVRISKSMLVNIHKVERLKSEINMKVHIILENGETVVLNRAYKSGFYRFLKKMCKETKS